MSPRDDEPTAEPGRDEPVPGAAHAVREVEALPDGRRVTWYRSSAPSGDRG